MSLSTTFTLMALACSALLILSSSALPTQAEVNHWAVLGKSIDVTTVFSPKKCYGSNGFSDACKWPAGVFVYDIQDELFSSDQLEVIMEVHHQITEATGNCITFRRKTSNDTTYVLITERWMCSSPVGSRIGRNIMSLVDACFHTRHRTEWTTLMHLFSLGLWVEFAREDRDMYVKILEENIIEECLPLFQKINGTTHGTPYDCDSMLHFGPSFLYSTNQSSVIVPEPDGTFISKLDAMKLKNLYKCN